MDVALIGGVAQGARLKSATAPASFHEILGHMQSAPFLYDGVYRSAGELSCAVRSEYGLRDASQQSAHQTVSTATPLPARQRSALPIQRAAVTSQYSSKSAHFTCAGNRTRLTLSPANLTSAPVQHRTRAVIAYSKSRNLWPHWIQTRIGETNIFCAVWHGRVFIAGHCLRPGIK